MTEINQNALDLLQKRYFREDEHTWGDLCKRVSHAIAQAEETDELKKHWEKIFYDMMFNMDFLPSTPCLINADTSDKPSQLSACFIIDIKDNIESIFGSMADAAKIFQTNGGVGFSIGQLRPENALVETAGGFSTGSFSFLEGFDWAAKNMTINNARKGAIKADLDCWHPDIYKFIHCKDDTNKLNNMNISVAVTDKFMQAVKDDKDWDLKFPDYSWNKKIYNAEWNGDIEEWERKGYPVRIYKTVKARDLYKEIMTCAWKTGEPGVSFVNTMDKYNPNPHIGKIRSTNP